jgi:hypothetical protein
MLYRWVSYGSTALLGITGGLVSIVDIAPGHEVAAYVLGAGFILVAFTSAWAVMKDGQLSDQKMEKYQSEVLAHTSGGDNFPYVDIVHNFDETISAPCPALIAPRKRTPLFDVHYRIMNADTDDELAVGEMPLMAHGSPWSVGIKLGEGNYKVVMNARNGFFVQTLRIKHEDGQMRTWIEVKKPESREQSEQVLLRQTPDKVEFK